MNKYSITIELESDTPEHAAQTVSMLLLEPPKEMVVLDLQTGTKTAVGIEHIAP